MARRLVIDPVTRIEGHLRIEAEMDGAGRVARAWSAGTMVRGIEIILKGRDPREAWAFTQRICGVCTLVHGIASVRALEAALGWHIPDNARLIRNLMIAAQFVHDHVMHFYHLHALDWVDVVAALKADPARTAELQRAISQHPQSSPAYFAEVQQRLKGFVESGQLGLFANGYWGHPAYRLPAEANLMALAHYIEALAWQREVVKLHALFGGKNPHPNMVAGGVACAISRTGQRVGRSGHPATVVNEDGLKMVAGVIEAMRAFVEQVYLPDALAIAVHYPEWFRQGEGLGNFLCYGEFPDATGRPLIPAGVILGRDLARIEPVDLEAEDAVQEFVSYSWYEGEAGLHPYRGETRLDYTGPMPPYEHLDVERAYSWLKAPRWRGHAVEVGPLARWLVLHASGHEATRALTAQALGQLKLPFEALYSTLGRTLARALETRLIAEAMPGWLDALQANIRAGDLDTFNESLWEPATWPRQARGVGAMEAPRGALAHWLAIEDARIANYQVVSPSTWNAGPRDAQGQEGAYEAALRGHAVHDPDRPVELLRTVHSLDPCIACAVHVLDLQQSAVLGARHG